MTRLPLQESKDLWDSLTAVAVRGARECKFESDPQNAGTGQYSSRNLI
jgi:hypothetical protein